MIIVFVTSTRIIQNYLGLQSNSTLRVGDLDTQRLGLGNNLNSVLRRDIVGDLSSVSLGVHQQSVQVTGVSDEVDLVTLWVQELGLLVGTVTDVWLTDGASESSSDTRVNTLLLSPVLGNSVISVRVMSLELLGVLLNNLDRGHWRLVFFSLEESFGARRIWSGGCFYDWKLMEINSALFADIVYALCSFNILLKCCQ